MKTIKIIAAVSLAFAVLALSSCGKDKSTTKNVVNKPAVQTVTPATYELDADGNDTKIVPASIGDKISLYGINLENVSRVDFSGKNATINSIDIRNLEFTVPAVNLTTGNNKVKFTVHWAKDDSVIYTGFLYITAE